MVAGGKVDCHSIGKDEDFPSSPPSPTTTRALVQVRDENTRVYECVMYFYEIYVILYIVSFHPSNDHALIQTSTEHRAYEDGSVSVLDRRVSDGIR